VSKQVALLREMDAASKPITEIAEVLNISRPTVHRYLEQEQRA
jgi:DNA-binding IclR family transcriptional regulator